MVRRRIQLLIALALAVATMPAAASAAGGPVGGPPLGSAPGAVPRGTLHHWRGTPSDVVAGVAYSRGEVIVTDNPFDDHGADTHDNTDPSEGVTGPYWGANAAEGNAPGTGGANGDYAYPAGAAYARNAADVVETRLAAGRKAWFVLVRLGTLKDPSLTAIELRIDGHVLIAHGGKATFDGRPVTVATSSRRAQFEVRIPDAVYDPGRARHRVFVAAGLWDRAAATWLSPAAGMAPYFDLAYVSGEGMDSYWRDARQSADIAHGAFDDDALSVRFGALRSRACRTGRSCPAYHGPSSGLFSRVFRSGQRLGQGVSLQSRYAQDTGTYPPNLYRSRTQPYAVYVPRHQTGAIVLLLHFLGGNYMSYSLTSMPQLADWAERLGVIVVMPLARGEGGWYEGEAEKDVFEAWRDVARHYRVDPDRVYLAGMSMGGFGTWRLSQLYPDLFARGIVWAGPVLPDTIWAYPAPASPPSCGPDQPTPCDYDLTTLFGNTRDLPLFVVHGGADELVPASGAEHWMAQYASESNATYRYAFYPDRQHETSFPGSTEPLVLSWLGGLPRRQVNPVHVTYKLVRALFQPRDGIRYDHAYWTRDLVLAPGAPEGSIDADRTVAPDRVAVMPDKLGVDDLGPYRLRGQDVTPAPSVPNMVELRLTGLARAGLDTRAMGWSPADAQRVSGTTDHPVKLVLTGAYGRRASVRGAPAKSARGRVTLVVPAGTFDVTITPR